MVKLKIFLGLIFIVSELFGMDFGTVSSLEENQTDFINAIKRSFKINISSIKDAQDLVNEVTKDFESRRERNNEIGANLLFCNGKAYINGFIPSWSFNNLYFKGKKFPTRQLCDILGYDPELITLLFQTSNILSETKNAIQKNYNYTIINWNILRLANTIQLNSFHNTTEPIPLYLKYLIKLSAKLGHNIQKCPLNLNFLSEIWTAAQMKFKEYLESIADYISFFNQDNGYLFKRNLKNMKNYIRQGQNLLIVFREYFHTEFLVKYDLKYTPIYMFSYYDMCDNCEKFLASKTPSQLGSKLIFVSNNPYKDSRKINRLENSTNKSLVQIRLERFPAYNKDLIDSKDTVSPPKRKYDPYFQINQNK